MFFMKYKQHITLRFAWAIIHRPRKNAFKNLSSQINQHQLLMNLNRQQRRFTEKRLRPYLEAHRESIVQLALRTARPMTFKDSMHANEIVFCGSQFGSGATAGDQPVPLVVHIPQQSGIFIQQRTMDSQHRSPPVVTG
jgi:hypothetical protein